jgi:hypothetical protein
MVAVGLHVGIKGGQRKHVPTQFPLAWCIPLRL